MYTYKIHIFISAYDIIIKYDKSYYTHIKFFNKTTLKYLFVDPPFCPPSTCPIRYLFDTLPQFPSGPLLLA